MNNTLQTLQKKRKSKKGFTLMEMLIVVAIIAILVAISIPVFNAQLDKAKENTDAANMRAAKAVAVTEYLTKGTTYDDASATYYYDAEKGIITSTKPAGYGQKNKGQVIKVKVDSDGTFTGDWK